MTKAERVVKELSEWFREQPHLVVEHGKENDGRGIWCVLSGEGRPVARMLSIFPCIRRRNVVIQHGPYRRYTHIENPTTKKVRDAILEIKNGQQ